MNQTLRTVSTVVAAILALVVHLSAAVPVVQGTPPCGPCVTSSFVAGNRCSYWSIDSDGVTCGSPSGGLFRLDSATKKVDYRFTLSPALTWPQSIDEVWIYYRTIGTWSNQGYSVSLCQDANRRPGQVMNTTKFQPLQPSGTKDWHKITLSSVVGGLVPGDTYHLVIEPTGIPSAFKCIELIAARGRFPVRYVPTDAFGSAALSPCDRWLAVMLADSSTLTPKFFVEASAAGGITPIFAVNIVGSGLFGQPFNAHREKLIFGTNEYGQKIDFADNTLVNYVAFWTRGMGCTGDPGVTHELQLRVLDASFAQIGSTTTIPATQYYRGRNHWFGVFLGTTLSLSGTHYLVLSSPNSTGAGTDGWIFNVETSTLSPSVGSPPTYGRDLSYAVKSTPTGFDAISTNADTGFIVGYFPGGSTEIGGVCDYDATIPCTLSSTETFVYAKRVRSGAAVTFSASSRNSGGNHGHQFWLRLLDLDCTPLSSRVYAAGVSENTDVKTLPAITHKITSDAFVWLEFGHRDSIGVDVTDEYFPIEVRVDDYDLCDSP